MIVWSERMKIEELDHIVKGNFVNGKRKGKITGFSTDTRTIQKGNVFIALKGESFDGHDYLKEAFQKGCSVAIICDEVGYKKDWNIIQVENTYDALACLASYYRSKYPIPLIAVTGSVGKTTLKELIACVLEPDFRILKNKGNQNNHIGLPLTLMRLNKDYDVIITEMGMNHLGEIHKLSNIAKPDVALIINIGTSHIGYLGSKRNILKAKMEILDGMDNGLLIVNGDDHYLKKIHDNACISCMKCGTKRKNEVRTSDVELDLTSTTFVIHYHKKKYLVKFPYPGKHYPTLIAMAITVGLNFGIDIETCIKRIQTYKSVDHRLQIKELSNHITLIDDSYNASIESYTSAFELLKTDKRPKLIIAGDILELGRHSKRIHTELVKKMNHMKNSEVWITGKELETLKEKVRMGTYFSSKEEMIEKVWENHWKDCIILVKGSHALGLSEVATTIYEKYKK